MGEKAAFQVGDRVWVKPVGAWADVTDIVPVWAVGEREPTRLFYECGLGRVFEAHELAGEGFLVGKLLGRSTEQGCTSR